MCVLQQHASEAAAGSDLLIWEQGEAMQAESQAVDSLHGESIGLELARKQEQRFGGGHGGEERE